MFYPNKKDRHFRGRKTLVRGSIIIHPNLILGEDKDHYYSLGVTHSGRDGRHKNHPLKYNPNRNDKRKSYIKDRIERGKKKSYSEHIYYNYHLHKDDVKYVDSLINKYKDKTKKR